MSLKSRFFYKAAIGFSLGILITIVLNILLGLVFTGEEGAYFSEYENGVGRSIPKLLLELLTGGLLGFVGNGFAVVYEIESWGILKPTTIHFGTTMIVYVFVGLFNGWLTPYHSTMNVIQVGLMFFAYAAIWLSQYFIYQKEVKKINRDIELFKARKHADVE